MSLKALIFDVDGTLAETEEAHREAFNRTFEEFGLPWHWDRARYHQLLKVTGGKERLRHYIRDWPESGGEAVLPVERVRELHTRKTQIYGELMRSGGVPLRPGIARLIGEARAAHVKLAIATTTSVENIEALLDVTLGDGALGWFHAVGAGDMVQRKKPAPDVYDLVLRQLALDGRNCLAIEDSRAGMKSAHGAGVPAIITVSEYSQGENFSGALAVLSHLGDPGNPPLIYHPPESSAAMVGLDMLQQWHEKWRCVS